MLEKEQIEVVPKLALNRVEAAQALGVSPATLDRLGRFFQQSSFSNPVHRTGVSLLTTKYWRSKRKRRQTSLIECRC